MGVRSVNADGSCTVTRLALYAHELVSETPFRVAFARTRTQYVPGVSPSKSTLVAWVRPNVVNPDVGAVVAESRRYSIE